MLVNDIPEEKLCEVSSLEDYYSDLYYDEHAGKFFTIYQEFAKKYASQYNSLCDEIISHSNNIYVLLPREIDKLIKAFEEIIEINEKDPNFNMTFFMSKHLPKEYNGDVAEYSKKAIKWLYELKRLFS